MANIIIDWAQLHTRGDYLSLLTNHFILNELVNYVIKKGE